MASTLSHTFGSTAAAVLYFSASTALACSTAVVSPLTSAEYTASFRTMDFDNLDLNTTLNVIPRNSRLFTHLLANDVLDNDATPGTDLPDSKDSRFYFKNKYAFVTTAQHLWYNSNYDALRKTLSENNVTERLGESMLTAFSDGLNEKGLFCALLYDTTVTKYPSANVSDTTRPNIYSVYSICSNILGNYASTDDVVADMNAKSTQVVCPKMAAEAGIMFPMHVVVGDAEKQLWVMEFNAQPSGDNADGYVWRNATEYGVIANAPQLPEQLQNLETYLKEHEDASKYVQYANEYAETGVNPLNYTQLDSSVYPEMPGSYSSKDRFTRLSILNKIAPLAALPPSTNSYMPPLDKVAYANNPAVMTAFLIANSVTKQRAVAMSNTGSDVSLWRVIRDQTNNIFYFQAFADTVWGHVNVNNVTEGKKPIDEYPSKSYTTVNEYSIPLNLGKLGYQSIDMAAQF